MINYKARLFIMLALSLFISTSLPAQNLRIAAAANLQTVANALKAGFKKHTGINAEIITASSGKLLVQINNGAPYDVFLSADMIFPETLYANGLSTGKPVVYALGSLIICTTNKTVLTNWKDLLLNPAIKKIAIGNPPIAPYGKAAQQTLTNAGIFKDIESKLVYGESISQVNTYITTGVANVGFTSQSLLYDAGLKQKLYWEAIDTKMYQPIKQGMVLLKRAEGNVAAKKFYQYILSPDAKRIFKKYGYKTS